MRKITALKLIQIEKMLMTAENELTDLAYRVPQSEYNEIMNYSSSLFILRTSEHAKLFLSAKKLLLRMPK